MAEILATFLLLWAVPASGAEVLEMECPVCDHVDVAGHGLDPDATLTLTITDVKSGQTVLPATQVTADGGTPRCPTPVLVPVCRPERPLGCWRWG